LEKEWPTTEAALFSNQTAVQQTLADMAACKQALQQLSFDENAYAAAKLALAGFTEKYQAQSGQLRGL
jgi:NAD(P)-dependent dehydrogenase (short-subunit alcohol dehydrogenase family)